VETFPIKGIDRIGVTEHELQGNLLRAPKGGKQPFSSDTLRQMQDVEQTMDAIVASGVDNAVQTNGKLIILRHSSDYFSFYSHTGEVLAVEGQSVTRGQKIAELGDREPASTNLHFEIHFQGRPVDPQKYLPPR
jgi:lipoprotein NlpD